MKKIGANKLFVPVAQPPCLDCESRYLKCHTTCEPYIEWKKKREAVVEEIKTNNDREAATDDYVIRNIRRVRRQHNDKT